MTNISVCRTETAPPEARHALIDLSHALGASYPGEFLEALACYPEFLTALAGKVRNILSDPKFEHASVLLRGDTRKEASRLGIHREKLHEQIEETGLPREVISQLGHEIGVFHYANPKLLLLTAILNGSLEQHQPHPVPMLDLSTPPSEVRPMHVRDITFISEEDASPPVKEIFDRVKSRSAGVLPREYLAVAKHPAYLKIAVNMLESVLGSKGYRQHCDALSLQAKMLSEQFVDPSMLADCFQQAGCPEQDQAEIGKIISQFQELMPRHCFDMAVVWENLAHEKREMDIEYKRAMIGG